MQDTKLELFYNRASCVTLCCPYLRTPKYLTFYWCLLALASCLVVPCTQTELGSWPRRRRRWHKHTCIRSVTHRSTRCCCCHLHSGFKNIIRFSTCRLVKKRRKYIRNVKTKAEKCIHILLVTKKRHCDMWFALQGQLIVFETDGRRVLT